MSGRRGLRIILLTLAGLVGLAAPAAAQSIAVVVNGQPILTSEVQSRLALLKLQSGGKSGSVAQAQDELIDEKLKVTEAKRYGMSADQAQVDGAFNSIAQRTKMTPDQFAKAIATRGVSAQTLKDRLSAEIAWATLVRRKYASQIAAKERDAVATAADAGKASNKAVQYTLRQVVFVAPKNATDAQIAQRRSEAVAARGRFPGCAGAVAFAAALRDVAVKDPVTRSSASLGKPMNDLLSSVKVGGLTEPQRSDEGVEMIAVCERKDIADDSAFTPQDDQASSKQLQDQAEKYLAQLRSKAIIERR